MSVLPVPAFNDNYIWVLCDENNRFCDCVDPGDAQPLLQWLSDNQYTLRAILLTHHHYDHINGVQELLKAFPSCIVYGPDDARIAQMNRIAQEQDVINLPPYQYQVLANPGHTSTHISYFELQHQWLFCGDTLFSAGCGRVFDGTMTQLHDSLQMFKNLPDNTQIFCGHEYTQQNLRFAQSVEPNNQDVSEYLNDIINKPIHCTLPSTLARELKINPFLRTDAKEVQQYALAHGANDSSSLNVFTALRNQKNLF